MINQTSYTKENKGYEIEPIFIAESACMKELCRQINKIAKTEATLLLTGESGTGKEVVSRLLHHRSNRKGNPFVALNSGAIPKDIVETELFGYEKGAFTGANARKEGCFELADKGTLFLDEIGEMPHDIQVKLLRAVEYKSFRRIGGKKEIDTDVRIIAATNRDMHQAIQNGEFRKDLFYRLSVIELHIPPLRKRRADIPVLANHFLNLFTKKYKCEEKRFSEDSMHLLVNYDWPGNVREIRNTVERCVIMCSDRVISPAHLTNDISGLGDNSSDSVNGTYPVNESNSSYKEVNGNGMIHESVNGQQVKKHVNVPVGATMQEAEKMLIDRTLLMVDNNKSEAARILGFSRQTLHNKLSKYHD